MKSIYRGSTPPPGEAGKTHKAQELKGLLDCLRAAYAAAQCARDDQLLSPEDLEPAIKTLRTLQEKTRRALIKETDALKKEGYDYKP